MDNGSAGPSKSKKARLSDAKPMDIDTLIFDVDDTLYPVSSGFSDHRNSAVPQFMVDTLGFESLAAATELRDEYFKTYHSSNKGLIVAEREGKLPEGKHFRKDDLDAYWADNLDFDKYLKPNEQLLEILEELSSAGLKLVLFSNSTRRYLLKCCDALKIRCFFPDERIFTIDDVLPACKPEAAAFNKVLESVGSTAEKSVMFEDSLKNVRAAKAMGMWTVLINEGVEGGEATLLEDAADASDLAVDADMKEITDMREKLPCLWEGKFHMESVCK